MNAGERLGPATRLLLAGAPLVAGSQSLAGGFTLGIVTLVVTMLAGAAVTTLGRPLAGAPRTVATVVLTVALVSAAELLLRALAPALHAGLAHWLPLAAVPALVLPADEDLPRRGQLVAGVVLALALGAIGGIRALLAPTLPVVALAPGALLLLLAVLLVLRRWSGARTP